MSDNGLGWVQDESTSAWYYYSDGEVTTGWKDIDGDRYYFNYPGGSMAWSKQVDEWYLGSDGKRVTDEGWVNTKDDNSGIWYYVGSYGKLVRGWNKVGDDFHYFNYPGGSMTYDNTINGFYIDNDGKIAGGTGWLKDEYSGDWYYFSDGGMKTGWIQDSGRWYYLNDDGKMATGWKYIDGDWYYLHSDGTMATGWVEDDTGWYFLYNNGSMAHDYTDGGYHVDSSGKMVTGTGWQYVDDSWYYLKDDGEVATDWLYNQGNWYYLYPQGSMAHATTIDGYSLEASGKWVPKEEYIGDNIPIKVTEGAAVTYDGTEISAENDIFSQKGIVQRLTNGTVVRKFKEINEFFKYQALMGMGEMNGMNGEEGVIYVTDEQEKLADAGSDMLTMELGGDFVAIVANGVRAYKNIKTGEIIYNESYVAGSGAGNIAKGKSKAFDAEIATTKQKGNFGEIKSDDNLLNNQSLKDAGYDLKSIGRDAPSSVDDKIVKGIDGLYENTNANSNIKYVIDEAKFGSSKLGQTKDGLQMSDDWISGSDRILKAVDGDEELAYEIRQALDNDQVERVLSKIDSEGNVTTYRLNSEGKIIGIWP